MLTTCVKRKTTGDRKRAEEGERNHQFRQGASIILLPATLTTVSILLPQPVLPGQTHPQTSPRFSLLLWGTPPCTRTAARNEDHKEPINWSLRPADKPPNSSPSPTGPATSHCVSFSPLEIPGEAELAWSSERLLHKGNASSSPPPHHHTYRQTHTGTHRHQ